MDDKKYLYPRYIEPVKCPNCSSDHLDTDHLDTEHMIAWREVTCKDCGFEWREDFAFVSWKAI